MKHDCIFCGSYEEKSKVEHIVPESLGNKNYFTPEGSVCSSCNNQFSKFEKTALSNSIFLMERARLGIPTKKGKNAKGSLEGIEIKGHPDFKKQKVSLKGDLSKKIKNINPTTGEFDIKFTPFDKSEAAVSKLLLKIGLESIYTSQRKIYNRYDFTDLSDYLTIKNNDDWPFLETHNTVVGFQSIPTYRDKYYLNLIHSYLCFQEFGESNLLFKFRFGGIQLIINLLNRNQEWLKEFLGKDDKVIIHPKYIKERMEKE